MKFWDLVNEMKANRKRNKRSKEWRIQYAERALRDAAARGETWAVQFMAMVNRGKEETAAN